MSKNKSYKLSIITINFNNLLGLKRTVESAINQTWKEFEYIIIDGGSTDGSAEYIQEMQEHFQYWVSEPDKGIYNALNKGILAAKGEYLLFLNSGDWLLDESVLSAVCCKDLVNDIYYGNVITIDENNQKKKISFKNCVNGDWLLAGNLINHQSSFWKRSIFNNRLYDESFSIISDWAFFIDSFFVFDCTISYIDYYISYYHNVGISSSIEGNIIGRIEKLLFFKRNFDTYWPILQESQARLYQANLYLQKQRAISNPLLKVYYKLRKRI